MLRIFKHNGNWCKQATGGIDPSRAAKTVIWFALGKKPVRVR